jgi:hypothetical protein
MKKINPWAALLLIYSIGCTHVTMVNHDSPDASYYEVNKKGAGRKSQIELINHERYLGKDVTIDSDSTSWSDAPTGLKRTVPTAAIGQIQIIDHDRGALDGFLIGAITGAIPGGVLYAGLAEGLCETGDCNTTTAAILGGVVGGAAVGLVLGLPIGAAAGSKHKFVFEDRSAASRK